MKYKLQILLSTTRPARFADQPANYILEKTKAYSDFDAEIVDLRDYPLPFFDEDKSPAMITEPYTNPQVVKWTNKVAQADAFIFITAEYNHGYPAVLKNALDYVYKEWHQKPVAFVGYGSVGAARAIEQLRQVVIELQMAPIRNGVNINNYWSLLDENGKLKTEGLESSADNMLKQLLWWTKALKQARDDG